ncbi:hypothetical protein AVEN_52184-1 [Araneus ventricosus]|uniref:Uncharacterized protein n=1 Tax=Araneus ventricosus TaxID=182803 RepID=A0A4Y2WKG1_ARAVE|nr:hypothetical protein AVEN_52184-1 [Araneus ventricosus]
MFLQDVAAIAQTLGLLEQDMCGPSLTPGNHYFQTQSATSGDIHCAECDEQNDTAKDSRDSTRMQWPSVTPT